MANWANGRPRVLALGSLAEATCKAEDRIDGLLYAFRRVRLSRADRRKVQQLQAEYRKWQDASAAMDLEDADHMLQELCDVAESYLPPYTYLGTLEGDGADFGVWASVDSLLEDARDGEVWRACPRGDGYSKPGTILLTVPRGELWVSVSDHGNVSLYQSLGAGKSREVWGVV